MPRIQGKASRRTKASAAKKRRRQILDDSEAENSDSSDLYRLSDGDESEEKEEPVLQRRKQPSRNVRPRRTCMRIKQLIEEEEECDGDDTFIEHIVPAVTPTDGKPVRHRLRRMRRTSVRRKLNLEDSDDDAEEGQRISPGHRDKHENKIDWNVQEVLVESCTLAYEDNASACDELHDANGDEEERSESASYSGSSGSSSSKYGRPYPRTFYCCPVCYVECYRRLHQQIGPLDDVDDDESPVNDREENCFVDLETSDFQCGPAEILRCVDPSLSSLASAFCFTKLKHLKRHLKDDHTIRCNQDVKKNDVFHRFHMAEADGLVQRYLKKTSRMKGLGYMKQYFENELADLKQFHDAVSRSRRWRRQIRREGFEHCPQELQEFDKEIQVFWRSFTIRGHRIWKVLQQAYRREDYSSEDCASYASDLNGDDEGAEAAIRHDLLDRQSCDAQEERREDREFIEELEKKHNLKPRDTGDLVDTSGESDTSDSSDDYVIPDDVSVDSAESDDVCPIGRKDRNFGSIGSVNSGNGSDSHHDDHISVASTNDECEEASGDEVLHLSRGSAQKQKRCRKAIVEEEEEEEEEEV